MLNHSEPSVMAYPPLPSSATRLCQI